MAFELLAGRRRSEVTRRTKGHNTGVGVHRIGGRRGIRDCLGAGRLRAPADNFPNIPTYRRDLAGSHHKLWQVLADQNQPDKAAEQYRRALATQQKVNAINL